MSNMATRTRLEAPVPPLLKEEFRLAAKARDLTMSEAVRRALAAFISATVEKSEPDALAEHRAQTSRIDHDLEVGNAGPT
jgi:hypothetical protein